MENEVNNSAQCYSGYDNLHWRWKIISAVQINSSSKISHTVLRKPIVREYHSTVMKWKLCQIISSAQNLEVHSYPQIYYLVMFQKVFWSVSVVDLSYTSIMSVPTSLTLGSQYQHLPSHICSCKCAGGVIYNPGETTLRDNWIHLRMKFWNPLH